MVLRLPGRGLSSMDLSFGGLPATTSSLLARETLDDVFVE